MGREIKRVALNFDWPLGEVWEGYVNPHYKKCEACDGSGSTSAMLRLEELVRLILLSGSDAIRGKCHPYFGEMFALCRTQGVTPSPDMIELTTGLAGRGPSGLGHDACDAWAATGKIVKAAGLQPKWGRCPTCKGDGIDPAMRRKHAHWRPKEPPKGKGWQVWETVSEGSPVTPVYPTPEALASYLAESGDLWDQKRGEGGWGIERARAFCEVGWVPTFATSGGQLLAAKDIALELGK